MTKENTGPMLVEGGHFVSEDEGKMKALNAFTLKSFILNVDLGMPQAHKVL